VLAHALLAAVLGVTLLTAAGHKLADRTGTAIAAQTFGLGGRAARWIWLPLATLEAALAAGVLLGPPQAALLAAALLAAFTIAQAGAIAAGRSGAPCGCFGAHGTVSWGSVARTALLAAAAALLGLLSEGPVSSLLLALAAPAMACVPSRWRFRPGGRAPRLPGRPPEGVSVTLWSTALAPAVAYVTRIRRTDTGTTTVILSLPR